MLLFPSSIKEYKKIDKTKQNKTQTTRTASVVQ